MWAYLAGCRASLRTLARSSRLLRSFSSGALSSELPVWVNSATERLDENALTLQSMLRLLRNWTVGQCRRDGMGNPSATDLVCVAEIVSRPKALPYPSCDVGKILLGGFVADGIERVPRDELHNLDPVPIECCSHHSR